MTQKKNALFFGAASEIVTPFTKGGEVDHAALAGEIEFMVESGITGLFMNGLASEALMMSASDRIAAAKTVMNAAKGRIPVMGNVIANSLNEGVEMSGIYESMGVDAITITPPILYKYSPDGLFEFFDVLARATSLPVYIYNAPETGNKLPPKLVAKLFESNPTFYGYKDSTQNIIEQQTLLSLIDPNRRFELLSGSDAQIITTMMLGGLGVISLITVVFPQLIIDTVAACQRGDWDGAIALQAKVLKVREALKTGPFMAAYKFVSNRLGRPLGYMKRPLAECSEKDRETIEAMLEELGML